MDSGPYAMDYDETLKTLVGSLMAVTIAVAAMMQTHRPPMAPQPTFPADMAERWSAAWTSALPMIDLGN